MSEVGQVGFNAVSKMGQFVYETKIPVASGPDKKLFGENFSVKVDTDPPVFLRPQDAKALYNAAVETANHPERGHKITIYTEDGREIAVPPDVIRDVLKNQVKDIR